MAWIAGTIVDLLLPLDELSEKRLIVRIEILMALYVNLRERNVNMTILLCGLAHGAIPSKQLPRSKHLYSHTVMAMTTGSLSKESEAVAVISQHMKSM